MAELISKFLFPYIITVIDSKRKEVREYKEKQKWQSESVSCCFLTL